MKWIEIRGKVRNKRLQIEKSIKSLNHFAKTEFDQMLFSRIINIWHDFDTIKKILLYDNTKFDKMT